MLPSSPLQPIQAADLLRTGNDLGCPIGLHPSRLFRRTAGRILSVGVAAMAMLTWEHTSGASHTHACPIAPNPPAVQLIPWDTADDIGAVPVDGAVPTAEDLEGSWSGSATMTSVSTPIPQLRPELEKRLNVPAPSTVTVEATGAASLVFHFQTAAGIQTVHMSYSAGRLTGDNTSYGVRYHFVGNATRAGDGYRIDGTINSAATNGTVTWNGTWTLTKKAEDVEIKLTYPVGRSPKVFQHGWVFGAECVVHKGKRDEKNLSKEVRWSGTGTFTPESGEQSRPSFSSTGTNKITLSCEDAKKDFTIEVTPSKIPYAAQGDSAFAPSDAHGCPGCGHPVVGPIISGSPLVLIDGRPAARVGDVGVHAACCGPNMFRIVAGDAEVLINGRRAAQVGDATAHCGGVGKIITGRPSTDSRPPSGTPKPSVSSGEPFVDGTVSAGSGPTKVSTGPKERRALAFGGGGKGQPGVATLFPSSKAERTQDETIDLQHGGALVTTPSAGGESRLKTPAGAITLHSQAVVKVDDDEVELLLLTGTATVTPKGGNRVELAAGQRVVFTKKGVKGSVGNYTTAQLGAALGPLAGGEDGARDAAGTATKTSPLVYVGVAATVFLLLLLVAVGGATLVVLAMRKSRPPSGGARA